VSSSQPARRHRRSALLHHHPLHDLTSTIHQAANDFDYN
jgi:hypothetical protein